MDLSLSLSFSRSLWWLFVCPCFVGCSNVCRVIQYMYFCCSSCFNLFVRKVHASIYFTHMPLCICVCRRNCTYIYIYIYVYVYIFIYKYVHIQIYIYMHILLPVYEQGIHGSTVNNLNDAHIQLNLRK